MQYSGDSKKVFCLVFTLAALIAGFATGAYAQGADPQAVSQPSGTPEASEVLNTTGKLKL